jgi:hypothetical protein
MFRPLVDSWSDSWIQESVSRNQGHPPCDSDAGQWHWHSDSESNWKSNTSGCSSLSGNHNTNSCKSNPISCHRNSKNIFTAFTSDPPSFKDQLGNSNPNTKVPVFNEQYFDSAIWFQYGNKGQDRWPNIFYKWAKTSKEPDEKLDAYGKQTFTTKTRKWNDTVYCR